jgi:hypothetical protein
VLSHLNCEKLHKRHYTDNDDGILCGGTIAVEEDKKLFLSLTHARFIVVVAGL